jgi:hypothetical protein
MRKLGTELHIDLNGIFTLEIHNEKFFIELPNLRNTGILSSSRKVYIKDALVIVDPQSRLRSAIHFGHKYMVDQVDGFITEIPKKLDLLFLIKKNLNRPLKKRKGLKELAMSDLSLVCSKLTLDNFKKVVNKKKIKNTSLLSYIEGSWVDGIAINDQVTWTNKIPRYAFLLMKDPIPSDFRFREDLLWMRYGNIVNAQKWKLRLEAGYRRERKIREKLNKKRFKLF